MFTRRLQRIFHERRESEASITRWRMRLLHQFNYAVALGQDEHEFVIDITRTEAVNRVVEQLFTHFG